MAKHASTGAGVVTTHPNVPLGGVRAVLSNYDIDVDVPKREHIAFLDARVAPILAGKHARLFLQGAASASGSDAHNLALSRRRAEKVAAHLVTRGALPSQIQIEAVGENKATQATPEAAKDRAVSLLAAPLFPPPARIPAPKPEPDTPTARSFEIRMLGGISGGLGPIGIDQLFFEILDRVRGVTSIFVYSALGGGRGGLPLSTTLRGPWNSFSTTGPLALNEFAGPARFTTGGAGSFSVNFLNMMGLPRGLATVPSVLRIETGFTVGIGASTSVGEMILQFTGVFTGP